MSDINNPSGREVGENNITQLLTSIHTEALRDAVRYRPFNAGSYQKVKERKEQYIQSSIDKTIGGVEQQFSIEDWEATKQEIQKMLLQQKLFVYDIKFPLEQIKQHGDDILTYVVRKEAFKTLGKPLNNPAYKVPTDQEGEKLYKHIMETFAEVQRHADYISREQIGNHLYNQGIYVRDSDALFLMLDEMAEESGNIIIFQNARKLYNPFVSMIRWTQEEYEKDLKPMILAYHRLAHG